MALSLLLISAVVFRPELVRLVPETGSLFRIVGLPVNLVGLTFGEVGSTLVHEAGAPVLVVEGRISNVVHKDVQVPRLEIGIEGERGTSLYNWSTPAGRETLKPGESMMFRTRLASPPPLGRRVIVSFHKGAGNDEVASR